MVFSSTLEDFSRKIDVFLFLFVFAEIFVSIYIYEPKPRYGFILKFNHVVIYLKNTLQFYKKKFTLQNLKRRI